MKRSISIAAIVMFVVAGLMLTPAPAEAQQKGQSVKVQHGVVVKAERVDLNDSKTTQGALIGGTIGLVASSGKSGKTKRRNTALGAVGGGLIGSARSTSQMGMMYTVEIAGGAVKVVTDQTEIHMGDCVVVEETSQGTNLRRVNPEVCDPAAAEVVADLQDEFVEEAEECAMARKEFAAAKTDAEFDRALIKVDILCNG
jgi:outer membrane lipoprotein SlyB